MAYISIQLSTKSDLEFSRLESWSRDVSRLVFTILGLGLGLGTLESRSRSWSWNLRVFVLVLVLEPSSLGLSLGLGTSESWSWYWSWIPRVLVSVLVLGQWRVQTAASIAKRSSVGLSPLLLWNGYLARVVCWCGQIGLEWATTGWHSWSTCDATISCKFGLGLVHSEP